MLLFGGVGIINNDHNRTFLLASESLFYKDKNKLPLASSPRFYSRRERERERLLFLKETKTSRFSKTLFDVEYRRHMNPHTLSTTQHSPENQQDSSKEKQA